MNSFFYLSTWVTCKLIMKELKVIEVRLQDIKKEAISDIQIDEMAELAGGYEPLFSRRSRQYKAMDLQNQDLQGPDYRSLILREYTFLKRPVLVYQERIFIGNSAANVAAMKDALS